MYKQKNSIKDNDTLIITETSGYATDKATYYRDLSQKMERQLDEIKNSISFRIGLAFSDLAKAPLKNSIRLPKVLTMILRDYLYKRKTSGLKKIDNTTQISGSKLRNQKKYLQPGIEEHNFSEFPEYKPLKKNKNSSLRIACIFGEDLNTYLDFEAHLIPLNPDTWKQQLEYEQPDFFIAQSTLHFCINTWRKEFIVDGGPGSLLLEILYYCRNKKIPTALWDTEYRTHFPFFEKIASYFDHIFVTDIKSFNSYQASIGHKRVSHLPLSVQPAIHNPVWNEDFIVKSHDFSILFDGWADILEWPNKYKFLKKLFPDGIHIVESRYKFVANKLDDLPDFRKHIMGNITYHQLLSALRIYRVLLISEESLSSKLSLAKKAIEATACGTSVVYKGSINEFIPEGVALYVRSDSEAIFLCKKLLKEKQSVSMQNLKNKRILFSKHTYSHRLQTICSKFGIKHTWKEFPLVTIITPTKRPENIESAFENYKNQKYPHTEWIIVLNSSQTISADIKKICDENSDIRIFQLHEEKNIGACLNLGIEKAVGDYWFKMDDDDLYGPNYVLDMMREARSVDADIFGKPRGFIYFKKINKLMLRDNAMNSQHLYGKYDVPHMCGATISGKINIYQKVQFSEDKRAYVDTDFIRRCINEAELGIYLSNLYGYVTIRGKSKTQHTWLADEATFKRSSIYFGRKEAINEIMN